MVILRNSINLEDGKKNPDRISKGPIEALERNLNIRHSQLILMKTAEPVLNRRAFNFFKGTETFSWCTHQDRIFYETFPSLQIKS